jgi:hypothetical protein
MMVGDFNLMRSPVNRNCPGGNANDMLPFNDIIQHLELVEIPLKDRAYTWSKTILYWKSWIGFSLAPT